MKCMHCDNDGVARDELTIQDPFCEVHYNLMKRLETQHERYLSTRKRVRESQQTASISRRQKIKTRYATVLAIKAGAIEKTPCTVCGDVSSQAHHFDYADPMNVAFLCEMHHREWHRNN